MLSAEVVQNMSLRPLTEAEQQLVSLSNLSLMLKLNLFLLQIENLLKEDKKDVVLQTFFGAEVESRVRKCSICCCLIEGSDAVYASHYTETHECDPTFSCELCDQVSVESTVYFSHIQSHFMAKPKKSTIKRYLIYIYSNTILKIRMFP